MIAKAEGNELDEVYVELFGDTIQKAVYADTPQNRKLGRVGKEYHRGRKKKNVDDGNDAKKKPENRKQKEERIRNEIQEFFKKLRGKKKK